MRTNNKEVKNAVRVHIQEYYTAQELKDQVEYIRQGSGARLYPTVYHAVKHMVEGGCFLIYHEDVKNFLNSLGINPTNKEYDNIKSWELYCHLIARDAELIVKNA
jgi:hypothetical protein